MRFSTTLLQMGRNTGIEVPSEVVEALGGGKRAAVEVVVNGFAYRSTLAVMAGKQLIPFSSDKRAATGLTGGDPIDVDLALDTGSRAVEAPADLAEAIDGAGVRAHFDALSPSARKAHIRNVETAKAPETRQRRIDAIVAKLVG